MSERIAYLTLSNRDGFFVYDHLTFEPLRALGWLAEEVAWDLPQIDWRQFAAVVIRSPWDYQKRADAFLEVLETIERSGVRLLNDLATVRWNIHKTYLRDLEKNGVPIVPTVWCDNLNSEADLRRLGDCVDGEEWVIKPTVGANADDTFRLAKGELPQEVREQILTAFRNRELMAQPFVTGIVEEGEYSLFYFGGTYSHAVLKRPALGDFRVQEEHGGIISTVHPGASQLEVGARTLAALPSVPLYARVDLVPLPNQSWGVIEVELIEPSLYFSYDPDSPARFARALDSALRNQP